MGSGGSIFRIFFMPLFWVIFIWLHFVWGPFLKGHIFPEFHFYCRSSFLTGLFPSSSRDPFLRCSVWLFFIFARGYSFFSKISFFNKSTLYILPFFSGIFFLYTLANLLCKWKLSKKAPSLTVQRERNSWSDAEKALIEQNAFVACR